MIPRRIWQTFKYHELPDRARSLAESWKKLNRGYGYELLDDAGIDRFMEENFDAELVGLFRAMPLGVMRADIWRYAVLYVHGGIYSDIDTECLVPAEDWLPQAADLVVALENREHFCQWTIAAVAGHPVLRIVLDLIRERALAGIDTSYPHFVHRHTGPGIWTDALRRYFEMPDARAGEIFESHCWQGSGVELLDTGRFDGDLVRHVHGSLAWRKDEQYDSWRQQADCLFDDPRAVPLRDTHWMLQFADGGYRLSNPRTRGQFSCNDSAIVVLSLCDGNRSVAEIAAFIAGQLGEPPAKLHYEVMEVVTDLCGRGVLRRHWRMPDDCAGFQRTWMDLAGVEDLELYRRIKLSCADTDSFLPEPSLIERIGSPGHYLAVLDFGCGAGRNLRGFLEHSPSWSVVGYDNPAMLQRAGEYLDRVLRGGPQQVSRYSLLARWPEIMKLQLDVAVASLVFQHMRQEDILSTLQDMARITQRLVVLSRNASDEGEDVMQLILESGRWQLLEREDDPPGSCHLGHWVASFKGARC